MCGILGAIFSKSSNLNYALAANNKRGRDSWGLWTSSIIIRNTFGFNRLQYEHLYVEGGAIANLRAEPTTEHVKEKSKVDVQPYEVGDWVIVHNGTIANDKELCKEWCFDPPTRIDSWVIAALLDSKSHFNLTYKDVFEWAINQLIGSYAIIAINKNNPYRLYYAANYRPLYKHLHPNGIILSSVPLSDLDTLLPSYSWGQVSLNRVEEKIYHVNFGSLYKAKTKQKKKALVVYSGGLDSTVAASKMQSDGWDVTLLHFDYGCRATGPERQAVEAVSRRLNVPLDIVKTSVFTDIIKGSRLTNTKSEFAEGEAGAEYAHEWVPARNTILLSIALGIAESRDFDAIVLGANLEEAGAYPDNEPEFLRQFNKLIPFAVGDGKKIEIITPVGNLMKHEIVKLGLEIGAPMELSWSCYNSIAEYVPAPEFIDEKIRYRHCRKCGPCFMRKTAFEINGSKDPVFEAIEI